MTKGTMRTYKLIYILNIEAVLTELQECKCS